MSSDSVQLIVGAKPLLIPKRYLTDDEVVWIRSARGTDVPFRVRIWRGKDATPIVLVGSHDEPGHRSAPPAFYTVKTANFVMSAMLGYSKVGMLYFEHSVNCDGHYVHQILFEYFGKSAHRLKLFKPITKKVSWEYLEMIVGGKVER